MDVFDANRVLPRDPNEEWPKRDPPKDELLKLAPPECGLPKCDPLKPAPPWVGPGRVVHPVSERVPDDALLDGPKERQPPSDLPPLCAEKPELLKPLELRPPLKRAELPALPNECHFPSLKFERELKLERELKVEREFDERFPDEPKLRLDSNPRFPPLILRDELNPPYDPLLVP
jgi:hypothetical protein